MAHQRICQIKKCPEKTYGRLSDPENRRRVDLCLGHFDLTKGYYGDKIVIVEEWGTRPAPIEGEEIDSAIERINKARENTNV